jgi:hypothetical protein
MYLMYLHNCGLFCTFLMKFSFAFLVSDVAEVVIRLKLKAFEITWFELYYLLCVSLFV